MKDYSRRPAGVVPHLVCPGLYGVFTWRSFNVFHIKLSCETFPIRVFDGPAPDQVRLVGHQDDRQLVQDLRPLHQGQHPGRGGETLLVIHGHHHQDGVGVVGGQLVLQGHLSKLVVYEEEAELFVVY